MVNAGSLVFLVLIVSLVLVVPLVLMVSDSHALLVVQLTGFMVLGITAAAGTRLALQLFLIKGFKLFSFQLPNRKSPAFLFIIYYHYLPE